MALITKIAKTRRFPSGRIQAQGSDGRTVYEISLEPLSCTCKGFQRYGHCYHSATAVERYAPKPVEPKRIRFAEISPFVDTAWLFESESN